MLRRWGMMADVSSDLISDRNRWAATVEGYDGGGDDVTVAHRDSGAATDLVSAGGALVASARTDREEELDGLLAQGATGRHSAGAREHGSSEGERVSGAGRFPSSATSNLTPVTTRGGRGRSKDGSVRGSNRRPLHSLCSRDTRGDVGKQVAI